MQITDYAAAYFSILWFAIDDEGHILVADSSEGNVPLFVKENGERAEQISHILLNTKAIERGRNPAIDFKTLAAKGFYCFKCDDYDGTTYHQCAKPQRSLNISELCEDVQALLQPQKVTFNIDNVRSFSITQQP